MELAYTAGGNGTDLVLIHAFPLNQHMWEPNVRRLMDAHSLLAPSLRGFGLSSETPSATMDDMARDILDLMDSLRIRKAVVGGLSMGGYVSLALWRLAPERVHALILADTRAQADTPEGKANRSSFADAVRTGGPQVAADRLLPGLLSPAALPSTRDFVQTTILRNGRNGIAAALLGMGARPDSTPTLATVTVPTLVLCGEKDTLTPPADSKKLVEGIKGARYVEIPGAGHLSNIENPSAFNEAIVEFTRSLNLK